MSAGLERESDTTPAASLVGERAADWAAENTKGRPDGVVTCDPVPIAATANLRGAGTQGRCRGRCGVGCQASYKQQRNFRSCRFRPNKAAEGTPFNL